MTVLTLSAQHQSRGAHVRPLHGVDIPDHYGQPAEEHLAVRRNVGVADLSMRGIYRITGEDRVTWLQNLVSNDVNALATGQGCYSAFMNHKGKMLSYLRIVRLDDVIVLEDVGEVGDATYQHLRKFLLYGTKVTLDNCLESWGILLVAGPSAPAVVRDAFGVDLEHSTVLAAHTTHIGDQPAVFVRTEETGEFDIEMWMPKEALAAAWERLWAAGEPKGMKAVGYQALETLRLEAGIPKLGPDLNEDIVPPEANLEGRGFSLTKGCYPGQEVVARMDTYGSVKRRMVGLLIRADPNQVPEPGSKLFHDEREVGWVSSTGYSPILNAPIALGFPLRDFTQPETDLTVDIGGTRYPARVHALPFTLPT